MLDLVSHTLRPQDHNPHTRTMGKDNEVVSVVDSQLKSSGFEPDVHSLSVIILEQNDPCPLLDAYDMDLNSLWLLMKLLSSMQSFPYRLMSSWSDY